jgi:hypothetical protein
MARATRETSEADLAKIRAWAVTKMCKRARPVVMAEAMARLDAVVYKEMRAEIREEMEEEIEAIAGEVRRLRERLMRAFPAFDDDRIRLRLRTILQRVMAERKVNDEEEVREESASD